MTGIKLGGGASGNSLQLFSLIFSAIILLQLCYRSTRRLNTVQKLVIVILVGIPINIWQISNSYDDLWMMSMLLSAVIFTERNYKNSKMRQTFFTSIVIGSIATVKFSLMPVVAIMITMLAIRKFWKQEKDVLRSLFETSAMFFGFVISLIPFYGWKWIAYSNPVWPLFNNVFKAPGVPFEYIKYNLPYSKLSIYDFLISPFTTLFQTSKWDEMGAPGSYLTIYSLILACIAIVLLSLSKQDNKISLIAIAAFSLNWIINYRYSRYLLHIFPVAMIPLLDRFTVLNDVIKRNGIRKSSVFRELPTLMAGILCAISFTIGNPANPNRIPYHYILSSDSSDQYLRTISPSYRLIEDLNSKLPKDAYIVSSVLHERAWLRSDIDLYHSWETNEVINRKSWNVSLTSLNPSTSEELKCLDSEIFEVYTITPPGCAKK